MLEPEVTKGLAAAAAITLGLVVFFVAIEEQYCRVARANRGQKRRERPAHQGRALKGALENTAYKLAEATSRLSPTAMLPMVGYWYEDQREPAGRRRRVPR